MKCEECKYWEGHCIGEIREHRLLTQPEDECKECSMTEIKCDEGNSGFCHRYPPTMGDGQYHISTWNDNWCGEFETKTISANKPAFSDIGWSVRVRNTLRKLGIDSWEKLTDKTAADLLSMRNFGLTALHEVEKKLKEYNLRLKGD